MGHVVNPLAFRLGKVNFWNFNYYHFKNRIVFNSYFFLCQQVFNICVWILRDNTLNFFLQRFKRFITRKNLFYFEIFSFLQLRRSWYLQVNNFFIKIFIKKKIFQNKNLGIKLLVLPQKKIIKNFNNFFFLKDINYYLLKKKDQKIKFYFNYLKKLRLGRYISGIRRLQKYYTKGKKKLLKSRFFFFKNLQIIFLNLFLKTLIYLKEKIKQLSFFYNYKILSFSKIKKWLFYKKKNKFKRRLKKRLLLFRMRLFFKFKRRKMEFFKMRRYFKNNFITENIQLVLYFLILQFNCIILRLLQLRFFIMHKCIESVVIKSNISYLKNNFLNELSKLTIFITNNTIKINLFINQPDLFLKLITFNFKKLKKISHKSLFALKLRLNFLQILLYFIIYMKFFFVDIMFYNYIFNLFNFVLFKIKYYKLKKQIFFRKKKKKFILSLLQFYFKICSLKLKRFVKLYFIDFIFDYLFIKQKQIFLQKFLQKVFKDKICFLNFHLLKISLFNSQIIFKFIQRQLIKNKSLLRVMNILLEELKKQIYLLGFKILTSGRFSRKERAFYKIWTFGKLPLSTITKSIDYFAGTFKSKFGLCSVRVWLFKNE